MPVEKRTTTIKSRTYHFVGIGGCGMSGLAAVLAQHGYRVTGSDMQSSEVVDRLGRQGIRVQVGHGVEHLPGQVDCLVVSAAVKGDNPEVLWAKERGIRICKYAEMLGELTREIRTLAVAGTHGKSTTSGWLAYMLKEAGRNPSFVIGAHVVQLGSGSGAGIGEHLVVEACEYDRSFLNLQPWAAGILNIEEDHLDYYSGIAEIKNAFRDFAERVVPGGVVVANGDDVKVRETLDGVAVECEYYSVMGEGSWQAVGIEYENGQGVFDLVYEGRKVERVKLTLAGTHNVCNALAVAALGRRAGLAEAEICQGLAGFTGVGRRMSYKGEVGGVVVVDDYGHHPTEIRVTLEAIRSKYQPKRLFCVFQPHQHSRTRFFLSEFALSFGKADVVLLPDIYFVRDSETMRAEITAGRLAERIAAEGGRAKYLGDFESILEYLCGEVKSGDVVVTMGAGDVWKLADEFVCRLGSDSQRK